MLDSILNSIAGVAQSFIDSRTAKRNTELTNQANRELAEYQYSKDLEMWNRGNEYNSPSAQMERLKAAGLNPNLVYGSGTVAGNTSSQLPKYQAPRMEYNYKPPLDVANILGAFQDFKIRQAQYDNLKAQRKAIEENTRQKSFLADLARNTLDAKTHGEKFKTARLEQAFRAMGGNFNAQGGFTYDPRLQDSQLEFVLGRNRQQATTIDKINQDIDLLDKKNEWYTFQLFSKLGLDALNSVAKLAPRAASRGLTGFYKSKGKPSNNFEQYRPRYNSPTSWRNAGY